MIHNSSSEKFPTKTYESIEVASPYLSRLLERHTDIKSTIEKSGLEAAYSKELDAVKKIARVKEQKAWMEALRVCKQRIALVIALADISEAWDVQKVTQCLSEFADLAVQQALSHALRAFNLKPENCGIAVFALGKLGAHSLNYSSDIDLVVLFDPEISAYKGDKSLQQSANKIVQDILYLLEERTEEGYVFRTDLRLRPDPSSTPPAVSLVGALGYYESVGQNWERAAFTKARLIAGDDRLGEAFLEEMRPFLWRKHLDFAMIDDIYSIKRQMNTGTGEIETARKHNVKTGRGGIREIEFYVQTLQLVWGGRMPELRVRGTMEALSKLVEAELVDAITANTLREHYYFLRDLEHRLQMVNDQQTHTIPDQEEELERFAIFFNFESSEAFLEKTLTVLREVHRIFLASMQHSASLGKEDGYLVFTGSEPDAETLKTLQGMGYTQPRTISDIIQGWHRGHRRATRGKRARQVLTEIVPSLLKSMATTSHPDQAFVKFDEFLSQLPSGVQLFTLLANHPSILETVATVMGSAPALGETLGRYPSLLEAIIHSDFTRLPTAEEIEQLLRPQVEHAQDYEEIMRVLRITRSEREFQAGVALLKGEQAPEVNGFLSELAEDIIQEALRHTEREFTERYGNIRGGKFAIIGLGKLGARELTFGSDVDIFFIYDANENAESDGEVNLSASVYYNRLSQRIVSGLTSLMREGRLYEVDSRMRPLGAEGPLACKRSAFMPYFLDKAWTFERMALCKARVIASDDPDFTADIYADIQSILSQGYAPARIKKDALDMRAKIAQQYRNVTGWHIKHGQGGSIDIDFLAQYLLLTNADKHSDLLKNDSLSILREAAKADLVGIDFYETIKHSAEFQYALQTILRLCTNESIPRDKTPAGLAVLLQNRFDVASIEALYEKLVEQQEWVRQACEEFFALVKD